MSRVSYQSQVEQHEKEGYPMSQCMLNSIRQSGWMGKGRLSPHISDSWADGSDVAARIPGLMQVAVGLKAMRSEENKHTCQRRYGGVAFGMF